MKLTVKLKSPIFMQHSTVHIYLICCKTWAEISTTTVSAYIAPDP